MKLFFYDFETTGLPDYKQPSEAAHQPHIVQAAAAVIDSETRDVIASLDFTVRPDGWTIPDEVAAIHGITTERALDTGVDEDLVVRAMHQLWLTAGLRVGHNESFDARIMRIGMKRFMKDDEIADAFKAGPTECTARLSSPICQLPPTENMKAKTSFKHKTPTLSEAYLFFKGVPLENAHSAWADVEACWKIYWAIKDRPAE